MENQPTKLDKAIKISIIAGVLIASLSVAYYFVVFLSRDSNSAQKKEELDKQVATQEAAAKKQSLVDFYKIVSDANDNQNWGVLYDFIPQTLRDNMTKEQFVTYQEKTLDASSQGSTGKVKLNGQIISKQEAVSWAEQNPEDPKSKKVLAELGYIRGNKTVVNSVRVDGEKGFVDRTIVTCVSDDCTGENRQEEKGEKEYVFANGKWQQPDLKLTERALSASTSWYLNVITKIREKDRQEFLNRYSYDTGNISLAIKIFAAELDSDLQKMIQMEQSLEKIANKTGTANGSTNGGTLMNPIGTGSESLLDKLNRDNAQECQQDLAKYNSCLAEYNSKLAEYNACLSGNSDPDKMFKSYCSKPFSSCFKPYCAY